MDKFCTINKSNTNPDILYLLSTSFFYLEKSYKSSQRYIDGILKIIQFINSNKYYGLRIYYDKSIFQNPQYKELYRTIKSNNKVELYQYTCSQFMVSDTFHIGTFGTLLRFLPLFEQSEYKIIYILDIDDANYGYIDLYVGSLLKSDKKFYFYNLEDYGKKYGGKFNNKFGDAVIANVYVKDYRFDIKIFTGFLEWIGKSTKLFNLLEQINSQYYSLRNSDKQIQRTYGLDEYFLNINLINTLDKKDIGWVKENLYFDYFFTKLINLNVYTNIVKAYLIDIIEILEPNNTDIQTMSIEQLKNILINISSINENIDNNMKILKKKFLSNYFEFGKKYKKITFEYYEQFYFIFNELYIDEFANNDFDGICWYLKKHWDLFPIEITSNIKLKISNQEK
jgi:hypothetical protein